MKNILSKIHGLVKFTVKPCVIPVLFAVFGLSLIGCRPQQSPSDSQVKQSEPGKTDDKSVVKAHMSKKSQAGTLKGTETIIKVPDGFNMLVTGNWHEHLEPCGCAEVQLGGIDRRGVTLKAIAPNKESRLLVDSGPLIQSTARQGQLKFETFLYSLKELDYDAIVLSGMEIIFLNENLALPKSMFPPVICTNIPDELREQYLLESSVSKTLIHGDQKVDCVMLAVLIPESIEDELVREKLQLTDPIEAVRSTLESLGIDPDEASDEMVYVMAYTDDESINATIQDMAAVDVLVYRGYADEPDFSFSEDSSSMAMTAGQMGKYITRLVLPYEKADDVSISNLVISTVAIDSRFPQDPSIVAIMDDYQERLKIENLVADEIALPRIPLPDSTNPFAGNSTCKDCHEEIYMKWQGFKHAQAMETLQRADVDREFDPECVNCHAVGMMYETGFRSMKETPDLADVGCEMCHGPGTYHNENVLEEYKIQFTPCEKCHDHESSPAFDENRETYFETIRHWHERTYWK